MKSGVVSATMATRSPELRPEFKKLLGGLDCAFTQKGIADDMFQLAPSGVEVHSGLALGRIIERFGQGFEFALDLMQRRI